MGVWDERFLGEDAQVVMIFDTHRKAFVEWLAEHGMEVFPIPFAGEDGELTLEGTPKGDLMSYGITPTDKEWKRIIEKERTDEGHR